MTRNICDHHQGSDHDQDQPHGGRIIDNLQIDNWQIENQNVQIDNLKKCNTVQFVLPTNL